MKNKKDLELVRQIIGVDPLDYARRAAGQLVIILPDGRKLVIAEDEVQEAVNSGLYWQGKKKSKGGAVPSDAGSGGPPLPPGAKAPTAPPKKGRGRTKKTG